jgi:hypothetical protein
MKSTLKNCSVDPPLTTPYLIPICLAKPSAFSIGLTSFSTVKKAAKIIEINFYLQILFQLFYLS